MSGDKLIVKIEDDGSFKLNARNLAGSESEIMAELEALAELLSGDPKMLKVEKHESGHTHIHVGGGHVHTGQR